MDYCYRFPVVKGLQANREYYIAMVPLKMIPILFPNDEEYVHPEYRAQRKLNEARIPSIRKYIIENRDTYVFSALAASIDGNFKFKSLDDSNIGVLEVPMDSKFLINDGQHRKAALLSAIKEDESLLEETISVVFYSDMGLSRSQQMFTDLNKHAVKTSNSIAELYDFRDKLAVCTRKIISNIDFLQKYTDKEKDNLGKYSSNLFTLSTFYNSYKRILKKSNPSKKDEMFLLDYWSSIVDNIPLWKDLANHEISKVDLRENYIVTQSVIIQVFGRLGNYFYNNQNLSFSNFLIKLNELDWHRNAQEWKSRTIRSNGRIINNENAIILTCNMLKNKLGLELDKSEQIKELEFIKTIKKDI